MQKNHFYLGPNDIFAYKLLVDVFPLFDLVDLGISFSLLVLIAVDTIVWGRLLLLLLLAAPVFLITMLLTFLLLLLLTRVVASFASSCF